jgi:C4-dicarboxylate-specific signal transduction histidine kinase
VRIRRFTLYLESEDFLSKKKSISSLLLVTIVMTSSIVTAMFTAFSIYVDYKKELVDLDSKIVQIEKVTVPSVANSLYSFSLDQLDIQVRGIVDIPDIIRAEVVELPSQKIYFAEKKKIEEKSENRETGLRMALALKLLEFVQFEDSPKLKVFSLKSQVDNIEIGKIQIYSSMREIYIRLITDAIFFFASQFVKTMIVSGFILLIFQVLLTRHLKKITDVVSDLSVESLEKPLPINLNRLIKGREDELDLLAAKFNFMSEKIFLHNIDVVDEMKSQKEKAEKSAKMATVGEMAGGIVHEINNPLAIIAAYNRIINRISKDDRVEEATIKIEETIERMQKIMNGILHFSHSNDDSEIDTVVASEYFEDIQGLCSFRLKKYYIPMEIEYSGDSAARSFSCHSIQLSQVVIVLVNNAIDAISEIPETERWIKIHCEIGDETVVIKVMDSGAGVPNSIRNKIMEPYYTTKAAGEGTGLGLSIAKKIVENHRGTMEVGNGEISTFIVSFPIDSRAKSGAA